MAGILRKKAGSIIHIPKPTHQRHSGCIRRRGFIKSGAGAAVGAVAAGLAPKVLAAENSRMAELTTQERLQPSLLDRLTDDDPENKLDFKTANFENNIYSVTKC